LTVDYKSEHKSDDVSCA